MRIKEEKFSDKKKNFLKEKERLIVSELLLVYCFFSSSYFDLIAVLQHKTWWHFSPSTLLLQSGPSEADTEHIVPFLCPSRINIPPQVQWDIHSGYLL